MLAITANSYGLGLPPDLFSEEELAFGIHGGEIETSMMLHLHPELVRQDHLADFRSRAMAIAAENQVLRVEGGIGFGWITADLHPAGAAGNAAAADAERGRLAIDYAAGRLARLIAEVADLPLGWLASPSSL